MLIRWWGRQRLMKMVKQSKCMLNIYWGRWNLLWFWISFYHHSDHLHLHPSWYLQGNIMLLTIGSPFLFIFLSFHHYFSSSSYIFLHFQFMISNYHLHVNLHFDLLVNYLTINCSPKPDDDSVHQLTDHDWFKTQSI